MKNINKVILLGFTLILVGVKLHAQSTDTSMDSTQTFESTDQTSPETITLANDTLVTKSPSAAGKSSYMGGTEVINIYSGRHEGDNIIRKVEVPLPEGRQAGQGIYIPR